MHGVKRLFAWMIPRFDRSRFNVSLISLRKRDLSDDTLESLGIDVTYMHRSKFDPATLPALLKELDRRGADVLHMHGYGATTFGRLAAARRGWPAILHEHANLTDTPWFQKIADRAARALHGHRAGRVAVDRGVRHFPPAHSARAHESGLPGRSARGVQPAAIERRGGRRARGPGYPAGDARDRHRHPPDAVERQRVPDSGDEAGRRSSPQRPLLHRRRRRAAGRARGCLPARSGVRDSVELARVPQRCRGGAVRVRPRGVSVAVGRDAADGARGAGDGEADRLDRRRRPAGCADARRRRRDRAAAAAAGPRGRHRRAGRRRPEARAAGGQRPADRRDLRHRSVREEDGAALRDAARDVARHSPPERARSGCVVSRRRGIRG